MRRGILFWLVMAIAAITLFTGCVQILFPAPILAVLSAEQSPAALHFFGLVGMFMALFGGALLHGLFVQQANRVVILWAGLQKFGAVAGVGIGVLHGVFAPLALLVTVFDFISGVLILTYLGHLRASGRP
jgi:Na+/proline symporter